MSKTDHPELPRRYRGTPLKDKALGFFFTCTLFLSMALWLVATNRMVIDLDGIDATAYSAQADKAVSEQIEEGRKSYKKG